MIVIGLKGFIGSGKTTVARHLIERHGFVRGRFAGALKDMLRAYLRYPRRRRPDARGLVERRACARSARSRSAGDRPGPRRRRLHDRVLSDPPPRHRQLRVFLRK